LGGMVRWRKYWGRLGVGEGDWKLSECEGKRVK
jgi:hypothetical protein